MLLLMTFQKTKIPFQVITLFPGMSLMRMLLHLLKNPYPDIEKNKYKVLMTVLFEEYRREISVESRYWSCQDPNLPWCKFANKFYALLHLHQGNVISM